ncbi:hypothetical protein BsWGS_05299 [Bradybaena similaris]
MATLAAILALTFFGCCLARPSNVTSYDCLTGDACNSTGSFHIGDKVFCCKSGDGIAYSSKAFTHYSFKHTASNDTSVKYVGSDGDDEDRKRDKGGRKGDGHTEVTCKCGDVDTKEVDKYVDSLLNRLNKHFQDLFQFWW